MNLFNKKWATSFNYKVHLTKFPDEASNTNVLLDSHNILTAWCEKHCEGGYAGYINTWFFEFEVDAAHFMLVWG